MMMMMMMMMMRRRRRVVIGLSRGLLGAVFLQDLKLIAQLVASALMEHVEGYHELSAKTKIFFATSVAKSDADFYVKVDDDVHVNLGTLAANLARHRSKPRVYMGCMKSGPILAQKPILHKYANEDVSLGSWFIRLEVEHI